MSDRFLNVRANFYLLFQELPYILLLLSQMRLASVRDHDSYRSYSRVMVSVRENDILVHDYSFLSSYQRIKFQKNSLLSYYRHTHLQAYLYDFQKTLVHVLPYPEVMDIGHDYL